MSTARHNKIETPFDPKAPERPCCYCGKPRPKDRRRWCSEACVDDFLIRKGDATRIKSAVFQRDRGICAHCGTDTDLLKRVLRKAVDWSGAYPVSASRVIFRILAIPSWRQRFWDADHIVPVVEGGGGCGLDGYRTLCLWCHKTVTAELAQRLAQNRQDAKRPLLSEMKAVV